MTLTGAIDIGGAKIAAAVVDGCGRILARSECPTESQCGFDDGLRRIVALLRETAARIGAELSGIGIGCTGPINPLTGILGTVDLLPGWQGGALGPALAEAFESAHLFLDRARQIVRQISTLVPSDKAQITVAALGADTPLIGAAQVWHHRFASLRNSHAL